MIGEKIKEIRTAKHISQKQLSEEADISISYIQQLEYGKKENPSLDTLEAIAKALDEPVAVFIQTKGRAGRVESEPTQYSTAEKDIKTLLSEIIVSISEKSNCSINNEQLEDIADDSYRYIEYQIYKLNQKENK